MKKKIRNVTKSISKRLEDELESVFEHATKQIENRKRLLYDVSNA